MAARRAAETSQASPKFLSAATGTEIFHSRQAARGVGTRWHGVHYSAAADNQGCESTCPPNTLLSSDSTAQHSTQSFSVRHRSSLFSLRPALPASVWLVCSLAGESAGQHFSAAESVLSSRVLPCRAPDRERTRERNNANHQMPPWPFRNGPPCR